MRLKPGQINVLQTKVREYYEKGTEVESIISETKLLKDAISKYFLNFKFFFIIYLSRKETIQGFDAQYILHRENIVSFRFIWA